MCTFTGFTQTALHYLKTVENKLRPAESNVKEKLKPPIINNLRQVQLQMGSHTVFLKQNSIHTTNAVYVYYQCGSENPFNNAILGLFCQS